MWLSSSSHVGIGGASYETLKPPKRCITFLTYTFLRPSPPRPYLPIEKVHFELADGKLDIAPLNKATHLWAPYGWEIDQEGALEHSQISE